MDDTELSLVPELNVDSLFLQAVSLIEEGRRYASRQVNTARTVTYWYLGKLIDEQVLHGQRASYGSEVMDDLAKRLTARFGKGYTRTSLTRMVTFSRLYGENEIRASLMHELSWTHWIRILPLEPDARDYYVQQIIEQRLTVRELSGAIQRKAFERRQIAEARVTPGTGDAVDVFKDPMMLEFLGLKDGYLERDLEDAIVRDMQAFLMEAGEGLTFVARQKHFSVDGDDFYIDLLFYSRTSRRLIAVELKIGKFKPKFEGQMRFYLNWLNRHERKPGEEPPLGLILCTEASREQVELLEVGKNGIGVVEYWTELPPKAELEARLNDMLTAAKERLAIEAA